MARNIKLLLTENVEALGIVGDVVNVRIGYARNFLLPREMATTPSDEAIAAVAAKRADAEKQLAALRKDRESLVQKMEKAEISITRSCNDLGHLYGSVTQQEIATALKAAGFVGVRPRDVRLNTNIKRIDNYDIHIKFEAELEATVKLHVVPDRKLDTEKREEMEFDNEGRLMRKREKPKAEEGAEGEKAEGEAADAAKPEGKEGEKKDQPKRDRPRSDGPRTGGADGDKPRRRDDDDRPRRGGRGSGLAEAMAAMEAAATKKTGWGAKKDAPAADAKPQAKSEGKPEAKGGDKKDKPAKDKKAKKE